MVVLVVALGVERLAGDLVLALVDLVVEVVVTLEWRGVKPSIDLFESINILSLIIYLVFFGCVIIIS